MELLCLSFFNGSKTESFYISDYSSVEELMSHALKRLLTKANSSKSVYIHNSSNFDLIILLKHITNYPGVEIEPIIKDGNFINLKIKYGSNKTYFINFKDSYLLLPLSLRNLAEQFKVDTLKSIFPYNFVTKENLNYVGPIPSLEFFEDVSDLDYNSYLEAFVGKDWNLKTEAVKYCELDCISLYKVIETFGLIIFDWFQINISSVSTLPSLAFKIFRVHFLSKIVTLPVLTGKIYDDIRNAYYGGHVDMYIPTNPKGKLVYHYDVNGLYPYAMKTYECPTNIFAHFIGNIINKSEYADLFQKYKSFIKVKVTAPKNIKHPILPVKVDGTTIYPIGTWTAWYYSEEIRNALKLGYKFQIMEGYLFESANLFSEYVNRFNLLKEQSPSESPMYIIAKLLLNSLYGRFAMDPKLLSHIIIAKGELSNFIHKINLDNLGNQIELGDNILVSYWQDFAKTSKINIAVAASITANARVYMSQIKNNPGFNLYYTDTDSGFIDQALPAHLVDTKKLGCFKLVEVLTDFVALAPKVYGGKSVDEIEFTKVKGLKTPVTLDQIKGLLLENNNLTIDQKKWFNHITESTISEKDIAYNLKPTNNKRNLIFKKGLLIGTSSKVIKD
uniref:DNA polymerase n=1 Tax=Phellinus igniarius TaxID=40472 RepID=UPI00233E7AFB|nr:DNA polymerase [Phellinus igniarius]WBU93185.1 DNA polymerase [Phellinus igniarius]